MRYDAQHKQRTHEQLLRTAAQAVSERGAERVAVADVMSAAGLTHGGFYAHFKSKDELIAAAVRQMFDAAEKRLLKRTFGRPGGEGLSSYIDFYLSARHRDARGWGCPMAALASDLPRLSERVREEFSAGTDRLLSQAARLLAQAGHTDPKAAAYSMFSELLGALSLARVEANTGKSNAILSGSRAAVKHRLALA